MHFAAAVIIAVLAAQSALSAPIFPSLSNDGSPTPTTSSPFGLGVGPVRKYPFPSGFPNIFGVGHSDAHKLIQREGFARELEYLLVRDELDGSEALKIPGFLKTVVKGIPHLLGIFGGGDSSQPQPSQTAAPAQRRDLQELEARLSDSQLDQIERLIKKIGPLPTSRPLIAKDTIQRRSPFDDESGALAAKNIIRTLLHIAPIATTLIPDGSSSHGSAPQPSESPAPAQRRSLQGSEALKITVQPNVQFGPKESLPTQLPVSMQHKLHPGLKYAIARELSSSLFQPTKGVPDIQNVPVNFGHGPIRLPQSSPIAQRELVELIARQMDEDKDDSGAFSVTKIVQTAKKIFNGKTLKHLADGASVVSSAVDADSHLASSHDDTPPPAPSQSGAPAPQTRDFMEASLAA